MARPNQCILTFLPMLLVAASMTGQVTAPTVGPAGTVASVSVDRPVVNANPLTFATIGAGCGLIDASLPISTPEFSARRVGPTYVELTWKSFQRYPGNSWYLERRLGETSAFVTVREIPERNILAGHLIDRNAHPGESFYRLRGLSLEGELVYSRIRVVGNASPIDRLSVYPNPFSTVTTISLPVSEVDASLLVIDGLGRVVSRQFVAAGPVRTIGLNGAALLPGTYQIILRKRDGGISTVRFVKE